MVYILEFDRPMHHAKYYIGYCNEGKLDARLHYHRSKRGARITAAAVEQGISFNVIKNSAGYSRLEAGEESGLCYQILDSIDAMY